MADHLYRSRDDRMLAGVAGGLADLWNADPSLVRIVWALLVIVTGGIALIVYIVMAIVVPEEGSERWVPGPPPAAAASTEAHADAPPAPAAAPAAGYWQPGGRASRRAARRAARRERRDSTAPAVFGVFLVLLGGFFLLRQWLPELNFDWLWPLMLIGLGVLLLVLALGRQPADSAGHAHAPDPADHATQADPGGPAARP